MITYHVMRNKSYWKFQTKRNDSGAWGYSSREDAIFNVIKLARAFSDEEGIRIHVHDKNHKLQEVIVVRDVS